MCGMSKPNGPSIEARRKELGITRTELGAAVRRSYKTIYGIERLAMPSAEETLQRIATALRVPLDQIAEGKPQT